MRKKPFCLGLSREKAKKAKKANSFFGKKPKSSYPYYTGTQYSLYTQYTVLVVWIGNFPNPNFVFPIFPIFPGKYKKQVYKSGYEFVKQNISQVFISEIYFPGNMGNINYDSSREIY